MSEEQDPIKQFEAFTKLFKESLTVEQRELYTTMLSTQTQANKYKNELLRPQREAEAKAKAEQAAAIRAKEISTAAEVAAKQAEQYAQQQIEQQKLALLKEKEDAVEAAKRDNATIKEVVKEVIREVPVVQPTVINAQPVQQTPVVVKTVPLPTPVVAVNKRQHYLLPLIVKALKANCHIWLVGPAGSGKTTLAASAASELGLSHVALSVCGQTTKTDLLGFIDAHGVYRGTCFRQAYEHGGVFCLDEIDNGNANVLAVLNSALASTCTTFPDKSVERHKDFIVIACANTYGVGATGGYVGRTQVDAATLDRFFFIEMPYDEGLEAHIIGVPQDSPQWDTGDMHVPTSDEWLGIVRNTRIVVDKLGIKAVVSPRATYMGAALVQQGVPLEYLKRGLLYKGLSTDTINKLRRS